jgi:hypothetical protein
MLRDKQTILDKLDRIELFLTEERMALLDPWGSVKDYMQWEGYLQAAARVRCIRKLVKEGE